MNKTFFLAWTVIFVVWMAGSFVVHGMLLHDEYAQLPNLFRTEAESAALFPLMLLAHVILAGALAWIYSRGVAATPWLAQGVRFGVAVALLTIVPTYIIYYVVEPMPSQLVIRQIIFDGALMVLLGVVTAFMYRGQPEG